MLTMDDLFTKVSEEGFFVDNIHEKPNVGQEKWSVVLRAKSKAADNAFSYFNGTGPNLRSALQQAAGNGGAISGRRSLEKSDKPKRGKRSLDDLL